MVRSVLPPTLHKKPAEDGAPPVVVVSAEGWAGRRSTVEGAAGVSERSQAVGAESHPSKNEGWGTRHLFFIGEEKRDTTLVVVVIPVTVAPGPVFLLLPGRQTAEIAMRITVVFASPLVVVDDLIMVPFVVVAVVRVIDPVVMMRASRAQRGARQGGGQEK